MSKIQLCQTQAPLSSSAAFTADILTVIDAATVCNPTGTADTLSVWLVPSGGSAGAATAVYFGLAVAAGGSVSLSNLVNHAIQAGGSLHLEAGTSASALTVTISGRTV
ncbi:MAG: hypothetical protein ACRBB0_15240 [Pelagimonas sp.]|uniref:hypothetical protein n=1 Tax=Pelagimonas sp. TaxID=2073170 RepID=UPI003D6A4B7C